tara:strand:+ start:20697 stop:22049 length:1353 start_codon:yes stop_codon:yes gene_type:complete
MNALDKVLDRVNQNSNKLCIVENDTSYSYKDVFKEINKVRDILKINKIASGHSVCLIGDYSIRSIAFLISLIDIGTILIPLTESTFDRVRDNLTEIPIDFTIDLRNNTEVIKKNPLKNNQIQNSLLNIIKNRSVPGLILFTSGSSGKPKAVVHDFSKLLKKFETKRPAMKTINFLMFDHWGGLNTFLHCFSNNSLIILPTSRNPNYICSLIEKNEIELLPTTPSFLNILLLGGTHKKYNLSSLKVISYGAEPMPAMTLSLVNKSFKNIKIQQTYGMIEIGVLRSKSRSNDSLWVKLGGEGYKLRVIDGILQVKTDSALLGYIGVDSPFTDDGYFITGDSVEQDGDWIRILGRKSELINVGGEKVYPAEVETIILENEKILDTVVYGSKNPLLGQIVSAKILINKKYKDNFNISDFKKECANRMPKYMVPSKIQIVDEIEKSERGKKIRKF